MKYVLTVLVLVLSLSHPAIAQEVGNSLKGYKSPLMLLPPIEWAGGNGGSPKEQAYFHGALETYGFILYGYGPGDSKHEQEFSDYRKCVGANRDRPWPLLGWLFAESLEATAAAQLIRRSIPHICQEYAGRGEGGWQPPRLVSKDDWRGYDAAERKFYVSAYVETVSELMVILKKTDDVSSLTLCMKNQGIDKVIRKLREIEIEWHYPMPWTISRAVGSVCKGR